MNLEEVQQIDTLKGALEIPPETPSAIFSFWLLLTALPSWGIKTTDLDLSHISRTLSGTHHTLNGFSDLHSFFFRQIYSEIIPIVGEKTSKNCFRNAADISLWQYFYHELLQVCNDNRNPWSNSTSIHWMNFQRIPSINFSKESFVELIDMLSKQTPDFGHLRNSCGKPEITLVQCLETVRHHRRTDVTL